ncbi:endonuclease/exonuclease/phosphatase family protein [Nocardioides limicola]|uniref:endonuclease/exonuclease/phosphatase family protein n=1 Tax=Nocardioides limicola TaxID=2803368 RepID=UPI00193C4F32|nr:endonuclease/exonuclease/phosphatase family protein [Nocardioides sp. DJM-14]
MTQALSLVAAVAVIALIAALLWAAPGGRPHDAVAPDDPETAEVSEADTEAAERATQQALDERPPVQLPEGIEALRDAAEEAARALPYEFTLMTFNVLGSNHTVPGGTAPGYAPGRQRAGWAADLLLRDQPDIVGFQELQRDQYAILRERLGDTWTFYTPQGPGAVQTTVMWRTEMWEPTWTSALATAFVAGPRVRPMVRLRHRTSLREIYLVNVHNSPGGRQSERDAAMRIQIPALNELRKDGIPVFFIGDLNERAGVFCTVTTRTDLYAARGGSRGTPCRPPSGRLRVDWIFGSGGVTFSGYREDRSAMVPRITDHAVISARVHVP